MNRRLLLGSTLKTAAIYQRSLQLALKLGGHENYVGGFAGIETTSSGCEPIFLGEGSVGGEVPFMGGLGIGSGAYWMPKSREYGLFFFLGGGIFGEHGSIGFGFSLGKK